MTIIISPYSIGPNVNHAGGVFEYYRIINLSVQDKVKVFAFDFENPQINNIDFNRLNQEQNIILDFFVKFFPFIYFIYFIKDLYKIKINNDDTVYIEWGEFALSYLFIKSRRKNLVLHDVLSRAIYSHYKSEKSLSRKALSLFRYLFVLIYERLIYDKFEKIFVYSEIDALYLREKIKIKKSIIIVEKPTLFKEGKLNNKKGTLTISGNFQRTNNLKSLIFIIEKVLPNVKSNYILKVIGEIPDIFKNKYSNSNITFTGKVEDYENEIKTSYINLTPLFISGGIFKKILDSMKYGIPTVSTSIGAESFSKEVKKNILIADDEIATAKIIDTLLMDDSYYKKCSTKTEQCIQQNFNFYNE